MIFVQCEAILIFVLVKNTKFGVAKYEDLYKYKQNSFKFVSCVHLLIC